MLADTLLIRRKKRVMGDGDGEEQRKSMMPLESVIVSLSMKNEV